MIKMRCAAFTLLIILIAGIVSISVGQETIFLNHIIEIELTDTIAHETIILALENQGQGLIEEIVYTVPTAPQNLTVSTSGMNINATYELMVSDSAEYYAIIVPLPETLGLNDKLNMTISFNTDLFSKGILQKVNQTYIFRLGYVTFSQNKVFMIKLLLPKGMGLETPLTSSVASVAPMPTGIGGDGQRILLIWNWDNLEPNAAVAVSVRYALLAPPILEKVSIPTDAPMSAEESRNYKSILLFSGITAFFLGVIGFSYLKRGETNNKLEIFLLGLSEDEQEIMRTLVGQEYVLQSNIIKTTGYSAARASKVVANLESKGLVEKEPYRKTNKIWLSSRVRQVLS